jgi:twitching motility protein PilT
LQSAIFEPCPPPDVWAVTAETRRPSKRQKDLADIARLLESAGLTLATLHTNSCAQTITRIIDVFPTGQQAQIRAQLSMVLEGVLSQILVPTADGHGRVMAMEIMVPTPAIRNLIRQEKVHEIYSMIQSGAKVGMQTMSQSLANLVRAGKLTKAEALARAPLPEEVTALLSR